jgi:response regulator RpfG family c-di-GMP phosphodiesterase
MTDTSAVASPEPGVGRLPRVLCVDDATYTLSALVRVLQSQVDVVPCQNPVEALSFVERSVLEQERAFAVVIANVDMPGMNGLEWLQAVRALSPLTTRLVLTTEFATELRSSDTDTVFRFLSKLCPLEVLRRAVDEAVEFHAHQH